MDAAPSPPPPPPPPGWHRPTGHSDPSGYWCYVTRIYDGKIATYTYCEKSGIPDGGWGPFLELTIPALQAGRVRVHPRDSFHRAGLYQLDVDVYRNGSWVDLYAGYLAMERWHEWAFNPGSVTKARLRCYKNPGLDFSPAVNEFEFGTEVVTTKTITHACGVRISYQVSSVAAKNVPLTCPYDGLPLGVSGVKGSARITNIDEMIGRLKSEVTALDERVTELEKKIEAFRAKRDKVREILGG